MRLRTPQGGGAFSKLPYKSKSETASLSLLQSTLLHTTLNTLALMAHPENRLRKPAEPHTHRMSSYLGILNTCMGFIGLISALCFGVIAIAQSIEANKQARKANDIAKQSLLLSRIQTCAQTTDYPVGQTDNREQISYTNCGRIFAIPMTSGFQIV